MTIITAINVIYFTFITITSILSFLLLLLAMLSFFAIISRFLNITRIIIIIFNPFGGRIVWGTTTRVGRILKEKMKIIFLNHNVSLFVLLCVLHKKIIPISSS